MQSSNHHKDCTSEDFHNPQFSSGPFALNSLLYPLPQRTTGVLVATTVLPFLDFNVDGII